MTTFEKTTLLLGLVNMLSTRLNLIISQRQFISDVTKASKEVKEYLSDSSVEMGEALVLVNKELHKISGNLLDVLGDIDALDDEDLELINPILRQISKT